MKLRCLTWQLIIQIYQNKFQDEQLVTQSGLNKYGTAEDFATMSHQQIQQLLRDQSLTAAQKQIIKKVRRRGKIEKFETKIIQKFSGRNKVAARKCRQRRVNTTPTSSTSAENRPQPQRFVIRNVRNFFVRSRFNSGYI